MGSVSKDSEGVCTYLHDGITMRRLGTIAVPLLLKMQIKIVPWRPNIISTNDEKMQQKMKVQKEMMMCEFKSMIEEKCGLTNAVIMRRTPLN